MLMLMSTQFSVTYTYAYAYALVKSRLKFRPEIIVCLLGVKMNVLAFVYHVILLNEELT